MREIKFRAWDKKEKKYYYDVCYHEYEGIVFLNLPTGYGDWDGWKCDIDNCIIEQYTGLKDSAENEIYEGDKFKIIHTMYIVCFNEGKFYLKIEDIYNIGHAKILDIVNCKDFEIIGNIHEKLEQIK